MRIFIAAAVLASVLATGARADQLTDRDADVSVAAPAYAKNAGPVVLVDAAHHNFHTAEDRFAPFAGLLGNDGYRVVSNAKPFTADVLAQGRILVIANALNAVNDNHWQLPTPSAFTPAEIEAVKTWVNGGGALLLIADHMPFAGAAFDLAEAFGFAFVNGFAFHAPRPLAIDFFSRSDRTLKDDALTRGFTTIATFTGSAFSPPAGARVLFVFSKDYFMVLPNVAWQFKDQDQVRVQEAAGLSQGAVATSGKGRIAVFGEAGMFTAQLITDAGAVHTHMGFNAPEAPENKAFILNVMHWLSGSTK